MKALLIPVLLAVVGAASGIGAAQFLFPPEPQVVATDLAHDCPTPQEDVTLASAEPPNPLGVENQLREYARLNNQFIVPVVEEGAVAALVVLSLSVEVIPGGKEAVFSREPKLRDAFLQVLFDHANIGGFDGAFTNSANMNLLRRSLREAAQASLGTDATDVLIVDIVRQDI